MAATLPAQGQSQLGANMMRHSPPAASSISTSAALPAEQFGMPNGAGTAQGTGAAKVAGLSAASVAGAPQAHSLMMTPEQLKALNQHVSWPGWHACCVGSFHSVWSCAEVRAAAGTGPAGKQANAVWRLPGCSQHDFSSAPCTDQRSWGLLKCIRAQLSKFATLSSCCTFASTLWGPLQPLQVAGSSLYGPCYDTCGVLWPQRPSGAAAEAQSLPSPATAAAGVPPWKVGILLCLLVPLQVASHQQRGEVCSGAQAAADSESAVHQQRGLVVAAMTD